MSLAFNPTTVLATQTRPLRSRPRSDAAIARFTQGALALTYPMQDRLLTRPSPTPADGSRTPAEAWASTFLQAVVEAVANERPVAQLARWTSTRVYADLDARRKRVAVQLSGGRGVRTVRHHLASIRVCEVDAEVAEVSGRVVTGRRSRAVAARLEFVQARWLCTELVFG